MSMELTDIYGDHEDHEDHDDDDDDDDDDSTHNAEVHHDGDDDVEKKFEKRTYKGTSYPSVFDIKVHKPKGAHPTFVSSCGQDGSLMVWDMETTEHIYELYLGDTIYDVEILDIDEKHGPMFCVATGSENGIILWQPFSEDFEVSENEDRVLSHEDWVRCVTVFEAPGPTSYMALSNAELAAAKPMVISGCDDGIVRYWDPTSEKLLAQIEIDVEDYVTALQVVICTPVSKIFVYCGMEAGAIHRWNLEIPSPDRYGMEEKHIEKENGEDRKQLSAHIGCVNTFCIQDSHVSDWYIFSGGEDGKVVMWHMTSCAALRSFTAHSDGITSLSMYYDPYTERPLLVSGSLDGKICLSGVIAGTVLSTIDCGLAVDSMTVYTPESSKTSKHKPKSIIVYAVDKTLHAQSLDVGSSPLVSTNELEYVSCICTGDSSDGQRSMVFVSQDSEVKCLGTMGSSKVLMNFNGHEDAVHSMMMVNMKEADDEHRQDLLVTCSHESVRIWDVRIREENEAPEAGVQIQSLSIEGDITAVVVISEGTATRAKAPVILFSDEKNEFHIHHLLSGEKIAVQMEEEAKTDKKKDSKKALKKINTMTGFTKGEEYILICGYDGGVIRQYVVTESFIDPSDPKATVSADAKGIRTFKFRKPKMLQGHTDDITCLYMHTSAKDGGESYLVSGSEDCTVRVWRPNSGSQVFCLQKHTKVKEPVDGGSEGITCLCGMSHPSEKSNDEYLLSGGADGMICMWNLRTGELMRFLHSDSESDESVDSSIRCLSFGNIFKIEKVEEDEDYYEYEDEDEEGTSDNVDPSHFAVISADCNSLQCWNVISSGIPIRADLNAAFAHDVGNRETHDTVGKTVDQAMKRSSVTGAMFDVEDPDASSKQKIKADVNVTFSAIGLLANRDSPELFFPFCGAHLFAEAAEQRMWGFVEKFLPLCPQILLNKASFCDKKTDKPISLLTKAIQTKHQRIVMVIMNAWISLLTEAPTDGYSQLHFPSKGLKVDELLLLASQYPQDFSDFMCRLKPLPCHEIVMKPFSTFPMGESKIILNYANESFDFNNLWENFFKDKKAVDVSEETVVAAYFLPLHHCADREMLAAYVEVCEQLGSKEIMESEICQIAIRHAWRSYGRANHFTAMSVYWVFVVLYCIAQYLYGSTPADHPWAIVVRVIQGLVAVFVLYFCKLEYRQYIKNEESFLTHMSDVWNMMDVSTYVCVLSGSILHACYLGDEVHDDTPARVLLSFGSILVWCKTLYFMRAYASTGPLIAMIIQIVKDIQPFLAVLAIVLFGFSLSFWILSNDADLPFSTIGGTLLNSFSFMLGNFDASLFEGAEVEGLAIFYSVLFMLIVSVLLLNLLIALMGNSYAVVQEHAKWQYRWEQASSICEQVNLISSKILDANKDSYFPKTIHYICRRSAADDATMLEKIEDDESGMGSGDNVNVTLKVLKSEMENLEGKINEFEEEKFAALDTKIESVKQMVAELTAAYTKKKANKIF